MIKIQSFNSYTSWKHSGCSQIAVYHTSLVTGTTNGAGYDHPNPYTDVLATRPQPDNRRNGKQPKLRPYWEK